MADEVKKTATAEATAPATTGNTNTDTTTNADGSTTTTTTTTTNTTLSDLQKKIGNIDQAAATTSKIVTQAGNNAPDVNLSRIDHIDTSAMENQLKESEAAQRQQVTNQVDNAVQTGTRDYYRAANEANEEYATQQAQINANEQRALDNQALYAAARGDRGGIGQAQYNSIQNTAAINRRTVSEAQTKMSTETQQAVADLRAQGEFEKADKLLDITQNYLAKLIELEQYAQTTNLSIDEFNSQLEQFEANYNLQRSQYLTSTELNAAQLTGAFSDGTPTASMYSSINSTLANMASTLISAGVKPTAEMISALGLDEDTFNAYWNALYPAASGGGWDGGYYGGGTTTSDAPYYTSTADAIVNNRTQDYINGSANSAASKSAITADVNFRNDSAAWNHR